jgi:hypothetical protein
MWTKENAADAAQQGWGVFTVFEGERQIVAALPFTFTVLTPNASTLMQHIITGARARDALCIAALRHIASENAKK